MSAAQRYGTTQAHGEEYTTNGRDDLNAGESSALLGTDAAPKPVTEGRDGHGKMVGSVSNLTNTIIGSGACLFRSQKKHIDEYYYQACLHFPSYVFFLLYEGRHALIFNRLWLHVVSYLA